MPMNKVLIVIDAQEDFTRGALRNKEAIKALPVIHEVVEYACKNFELPIFYTQDTHFDNYLETPEGINLPVKHCIYGTPGREVCTEVLPSKDFNNFYRIDKSTFAFTNWEEFSELNVCDEIWLCGFCTDICVSANFQFLKAYYPQAKIVIIEDACAGVTRDLHDAALSVMASCQAHIITWENLKENGGS